MVLKHRVIVGCGLGVAAAAIAGVVGSAGALRGFEHFTWDQRARTLATPADPKIKLILLDQPSLDWSERVNNLAWPWPREVYVPIIEFCRRAGVRSIAFDVLYTEPSAYGVEDDMALGAAIAATPSFVCAVQPLRDGDAVRWPDAAAAGFLQVKGLDRWSRSVRRAGAVLPCAAFAVDEIAERVAMHAHVRGVIDRDNVIRRALPLVVLDERAVPMLGLAAYMNGAVAGDRAPPVMTIGPRWLHVGGRRLPLDEGGRTILRYRRPKEEARHAYEAYSAAAVIESQLQLAEGRAPSIDPGTFRDCYVLFGFNAPGLYDYHPTPFHKAAPGVAIHATLLDNLLNNDAIAVAPAPPVVLFILATAMAAGLWSVLSRSARQLVAGFVLFGPLPAVAGAITYVWGYQWPVVAPQLALTLSLVGGVIVNYATEGRQRRFIKRAFQHYLSPAVIERVLEDPSRLKLGG